MFDRPECTFGTLVCLSQEIARDLFRQALLGNQHAFGACVANLLPTAAGGGNTSLGAANWALHLNCNAFSVALAASVSIQVIVGYATPAPALTTMVGISFALALTGGRTVSTVTTASPVPSALCVTFAC